MLTERENYLRNVCMTGPQWIPATIHVSDASWDQCREELEEVVSRYPRLFPNFKKGARDYDNWEFAPAYRANEDLKDAWGCTWRSTTNGLEGVVIEHPLREWDVLESYIPPDPMKEADRGPADWERIERMILDAKNRGELTSGGPPHGFFFMRMQYLRGFDELMVDIATGDERLNKLIDLVFKHNYKLVEKWISLGVDVVEFAEDLGMQSSSILSPHDFKKWIAPSYKRLMSLCRNEGCHVALHSDGYILNLVDILLDCGVTILNPQDLVNGIDNLAELLKGRVCIRLDIDRQSIIPFGTRKDIRDLIEEEVRKLGSPAGGLELIAGIYPPTPPENVDALCSAIEEFRTYWW